MDTALRSILGTYNPPASDMYKQKMSEVLTFKAHVFGDFGKVLLRIGAAFSDSLNRKKQIVLSAGGNEKNVVLTPAERTEALAKASLNVEHSFHKIEKSFGKL